MNANESLKEITTDPESLAKSVKSDDLLDICRNLQEDLQKVCANIKTLTEFTEGELDTALSKNKNFHTAMAPIIQKLDSSYRYNFTDTPVKSFETMSKAYIEYVVQAEKLIPSVFGKGKSNIANITTSGLILLGVLRRGLCICEVWRSSLSIMTASLTGTKVYPVRLERVLQCSGDFAKAFNEIYDTKAAPDLKKIIDDVRRNALDVTLIDTNGDVNTFAIENVSTGKGLVQTGIAGLSFFRDIGFAWNVMLKKIETRLSIEQEWMLAHAAILAAVVSGMDKNDPEYISAMKRIKTLEDIVNMIAKFKQWMF